MPPAPPPPPPITNIEQKTYALLSAAAGVTAYVPSTRIKLSREDVQKLALPYITHEAIEVSPLYSHEGIVPLKERLYDVSCFTDGLTQSSAAYRGKSTAILLAQAVRDALTGQHDGVTYFWTGQTPVYDPEVKVNQIVVHFQVFEAL